MIKLIIIIVASVLFTLSVIAGPVKKRMSIVEVSTYGQWEQEVGYIYDETN